MKLSENERVLCAYARKAEGPGWVNHPVWVIIENVCTMQMRQECFQPSDQTDVMRQMYDVFSSVDSAMYFEAIKLLKKEKS